MEGNVGFVNLFRTQVKGILDILLDVAVLEITHTFRETLSNVIIQKVAASPVSQCAGDQCDIQEVLTCRLKNSLEEAILAHGRTAETTSRWSVAAIPVCQVGGDVDDNLKEETCDRNWNVLEVGVFEGNIDSLRDSFLQNEEPHCTQSEFTGITSVAPGSEDNSPLTSASERPTEKVLQFGTTSSPHPVLIKKEMEQFQCSSVGPLEGQHEKQQPASVVEKIETISIAVSIPVHHPEASTECNNPGTSNLEDLRNPGTLELKERRMLARGPRTLQHIVSMIATLPPNTPGLTEQSHERTAAPSSALQEHVTSQGNHVHTATQTNPSPKPPPDEKQRDRPLLGGLASLTTSTNVLFHELVKLLKPCSVRLEDVLRKRKVAANGRQGLRICWDCGKIFKRKRKLRHHQRLIHTGEKPYHCSECDRTFSLRTNLAKHQRIHSGEKPYGCKLCGKHFRGNRKLKVHIRFHTGEKPFGCSLCGKKYRSQKNFKIHMMTAHPHAP